MVGTPHQYDVSDLTALRDEAREAGDHALADMLNKRLDDQDIATEVSYRTTVLLEHLGESDTHAAAQADKLMQGLWNLYHDDHPNGTPPEWHYSIVESGEFHTTEALAPLTFNA